MKSIVLIACSSKKKQAKSKAQDLYDSPLFKLHLKYAESLHPDKVFILSAKHGLLSLTDEVSPYNKTLNGMREKEVKAWADRTLAQLTEEADLQDDEFILLAGKKYRKHLTPHLGNYSAPLEGLGIGKQLKRLKELMQ